VPSLDLLLLPLLGGYLLVTRANLWKFSTLRATGYHLLFRAATAGAILLLFSTAIVKLMIAAGPWGDALREMWHSFVPIPDSGKSVGAFLLGAICWLPLNLLGKRVSWLGEQQAVEGAILRKRDALEVVLHEALLNTALLSVTLKTGKVYVGRLLTMLNPAFELSSIRMQLIRSGHRDPVTLKLEFDVDYRETNADIQKDLDRLLTQKARDYLRERPDADNERLKTYLREALRNSPLEARNALQNYEIVLRAQEIVSVNFFDEEIYVANFERRGEDHEGN
jgi:hypothetical protein